MNMFQDSTPIMNITYIAKKLDSSGGGSNHSLDLLATAIANRDHDVRIVTLDPAENNVPPGRPYEIYERDNMPTPSGTVYTVKRVLEEFTPESDLFHVFAPSLLTGAGIYKLQGGAIPVIGRFNHYSFCPNPRRMDNECYKQCTTAAKFRHDNSSNWQRILSLPFFSFRTYGYPRLVNAIDRCFALSPAVKEIYSEIGINADLIKVMPNFYDSEFKPPGTTRERTTEAPSWRILYVGRLSSSKGVDVLLKGMAHLLQDTSVDIRLDIVGDGPERDELVNFVETNSIQDSVEFHGYVPYEKVPEFYIRSDIFVHPGLWPEPFGRTILEAMQFDCVPVVSNLGGPPWVAGVAGVTFERGNPAALAESISTLIFDPEFYETKQNTCPDRLNQFSKDDIVAEIESEYRSLVSNQ